MSEQLPPEGRLTDEQRARMRAALMAAAGGDSGRSRPWLTPVAAAAAVAMLLGGGAVAGIALTGADGSDDGDVPTAGADATSVSPTAESPTGSPPVSPPVSPSETPSVQPTPESSVIPSASQPEPTYAPGEQPCEREVRQYLPEAGKVEEVRYDVASTYLFAANGHWVVCDTWAMADGGVPTLIGLEPIAAPVSKDLFRISQNFAVLGDTDLAQYVAAGPVPAGVTGIRYTFPTGDTVDATLGTHLWQMVYLLPDPPRRAWTDPVHVVVTMGDGTTTSYDLSGMDLCAQINHGC